MIKTLSNIIKLTLSFVIAGVFSYFIFRDIDNEALKKSILSADYRWIILCAIMAYASVLSRAIRWRMLLNTMGHKVSNTQAYHAIAINYIANIALPRFGEVARCIAVKRTNNVPVSESVGTVLVERLIDLILLALITSVAILFNFELLSQPFNTWYQGLGNFQKNTAVALALAVIIAALLGIVILRKYFKNNSNKPQGKLQQFISQIGSGIGSVAKVETKFWFWFHTFFVWLMYLLMIYCIIKALPFTRAMGMNEALLILTAGTFGFVLPSPGGIGTYHASVIAILQLLNNFSTNYPQVMNVHLTYDQSLTFATLAHGCQTIFLIIMGIFSIIAVFGFKSRFSNN